MILQSAQLLSTNSSAIGAIFPMRSLSLFSLILLLVAVVTAASNLEKQHGNGCSDTGVILKLVVTVEVIVFEAFINRFIERNTVLEIGGGK